VALDTLFKLDPISPASNSSYAGADISENCSPSGINNALRALGQMVAQQLCYQSAAISASVSTNIATASTGLYIPIVGAGAINSFGVVPGEQASAAVLRILEFSSSASLSHGTALILRSGASRRTQPGDVGMYIHEGSSDRWRELFYSSAGGFIDANSISATELRAVECGLDSISSTQISVNTLLAASASVTAIALTGVTTLNANSISASIGEFTTLKAGGKSPVLFLGRATNTSYTTCGTIIPEDDTIPQNTEGDEVLSLTVTPTNASSILKLGVSLPVVGTGGSANAIAALFVDSTANAIAAATTEFNVAGQVDNISFTHFLSAGSTTQRVYRVRLGSSTAADVFLNGDSSSRLYGGVATASLVAEEILP
jgi:hypothetical protein